MNMSITHHSQELPHNPQCPQCCWDLDFMGNEEYGDNWQKYLYHCPHCGAELEVYEPLEEDKSQYPFWQ